MPLNIDTDKIIASGGSAGGHLVAATATIQKFHL
jgi:acetyl esterase/lipase